MPADPFPFLNQDLLISNSLIQGFLFTLVRVGGALTFIPLPGFRNSAVVPKIVLVLTVTFVLLPVWPETSSMNVSGGLGFNPVWLLSELALGLSVGILVAWLNEAFVLGMQILGLQAGYAYASMIDPTTQADSSTLQVIAQLGASLLFFATGLDRELFRVFAASLAAHPPGTYQLQAVTVDSVIRFSSSIFVIALRLALPLIALLIMVDVALALLGRINANLQMLTLAFPVKMLASMALLAALTATLPPLYEGLAGEVMRHSWSFVGGRP
jgi:flagellar biosynthetic protein FliR